MRRFREVSRWFIIWVHVWCSLSRTGGYSRTNLSAEVVLVMSVLETVSHHYLQGCTHNPCRFSGDVCKVAHILLGHSQACGCTCLRKFLGLLADVLGRVAVELCFPHRLVLQSLQRGACMHWAICAWLGLMGRPYPFEGPSQKHRGFGLVGGQLSLEQSACTFFP